MSLPSAITRTHADTNLKLPTSFHELLVELIADSEAQFLAIPVTHTMPVLRIDAVI